MGVPASEVGYISATTGRGDHEVHKGHVVALVKKNVSEIPYGIKWPLGLQRLLINKEYEETTSLGSSLRQI
jgi:hypothetical protein